VTRHHDRTTQPLSEFSDAVFLREHGTLCANCVPDVTPLNWRSDLRPITHFPLNQLNYPWFEAL